MEASVASLQPRLLLVHCIGIRTCYLVRRVAGLVGVVESDAGLWVSRYVCSLTTELSGGEVTGGVTFSWGCKIWSGNRLGAMSAGLYLGTGMVSLGA